MEIRSVRKPPLAMTDHFFTEISVVANHAVPPPDAQDGKIFGYDFNLDVDVAESPINDREYQVQLTIRADEQPGCLKGYDIKLVAVGFFVVDAGVEESRQKEIAGIIGSTLLYGAAREFLYTLTLRGPHPAVYLPTTSFIPDGASRENADQTSHSATKKMAPRKKTEKSPQTK
jgi:preprotein translocase subunit SecB